MKYFLDTEFLEGFNKSLFGKSRHFIDLISIGIVAEDGREYYAISKDFDIKAAWDAHEVIPFLTSKNHSTNDISEYWLRDNVLKPIFEELHHKFVRENDYKGSVDMKFDYDNFQYLIKKYGKSNKQIATDIMLFVWSDAWQEWVGLSDEFFQRGKKYGWSSEPIQFYGYYSAYDHVVLCSLFGKMIDLPHDFSMYTIDLKQMLDEYAKGIRNQIFASRQISKTATFEEALDYVKQSLPKQTNEHNALCDAKYNRSLFEYLIRIANNKK